MFFRNRNFPHAIIAGQQNYLIVFVLNAVITLDAK